MNKRTKKLLTIGWLYPELMSTYGDRGNIIVLRKRCEWRKIDTKVVQIGFKTTRSDILSCDIIFGGGAQDRQQGLVIDDLREQKGPVLRDMFDAGVVGLFVCGAPQLLGEYYTTSDGTRLEGLNIFDMVSRHYGAGAPRAIGNLVFSLNSDLDLPADARRTVVGFENHGGRTFLRSAKPLGTVVCGMGNNGEDKTEGAVYKNCLATYSHGPLLPKNPHIADWMIATALSRKYKRRVRLDTLDDSLEYDAHDAMVARIAQST